MTKINPGYKQQAKKLAQSLGMPDKAKGYIADHKKNTKATIKQAKASKKN